MKYSEKEIDKVWDYLQDYGVPQEVLTYVKLLENVCKKYVELKKQKGDVVKYLKSIEMDKTDKYIPIRDYKEFGILLRMLGEIDE